jgi:hypothetical protein
MYVSDQTDFDVADILGGYNTFPAIAWDRLDLLSLKAVANKVSVGAAASCCMLLIPSSIFGPTQLHSVARTRSVKPIIADALLVDRATFPSTSLIDTGHSPATSNHSRAHSHIAALHFSPRRADVALTTRTSSPSTAQEHTQQEISLNNIPRLAGFSIPAHSEENPQLGSSHITFAGDSFQKPSYPSNQIKTRVARTERTEALDAIWALRQK